MKTKQIYYLSVIILLSIFTIKSYGQVGNPPPGPCNFTETESFCFTNNSNYTVNNIPLGIAGCDYEVCVKVKPKLGCELNCELLLNPNGYYIEHCFTLAVGETHCFNVPTPSHPITDCFEVTITMKVIGHTPTMIKDLENDFDDITAREWLYDHCSGFPWNSVMERISGSSTYNFKIITIGVLGP